MKKILAGLCALCLLWLCACTAQPSAKPTSAAGETSAEAASSGTQTASEAQKEALSEAQNGTQAETAEPQPANISVSTAENERSVAGSVHITADDGEPAVHVVFTTDRAVRHVQVLSLMMKDFDEDTGKPVFDVNAIASIPELSPEQPLVVTTVFYGDLPNNGISYVDSDNRTHRFAVEMSGEDGSLFLSEF